MAEPAQHPDFEADFLKVREQLACPACYGELRLESGAVVCCACGRSYPVVDGIPVLIAGDSF